MKDKIILKQFFESNEKLAIHCDTEEKANKLLKEFDKLGKKWWVGESYLQKNNYEPYKDKTCYSNKGTYCEIEFYKNENCKIYSFEDIIFEEVKNLIPEIAKMLGVEIGEEFTVNQNKKQYAFDDREGLMEKVSKYIWEEPVDGVINSLLLGEYTIQKLPQLTEAERVILENLPKEYKLIARDKDDCLCIYEEIPIKVGSAWAYTYSSFDVLPFSHIFQFIQWEDEKPYNIKELLKGE